MRLTLRCADLLKLLRPARWLTTAQIQRRFSPARPTDTVRKRLRKLTADGYLIVVRSDWMSQALFALGPHGKTILEDDCPDPVILERRPPTHLDHFRGVNDCRIAAELADCEYFFAYWELPKIPWRHPLIPDAILSLRDETMAIEFDRGFEGAAFFAKNEAPPLPTGFPDLPLFPSVGHHRIRSSDERPGPRDWRWPRGHFVQHRGSDPNSRLIRSDFYRNPTTKSEPKGLSLTSPRREDRFFMSTHWKHVTWSA